MRANVRILMVLLVFSVIFVPNASALASQYDFKGFGSVFGLEDVGIPMNYSGTCKVQMSTKATYVSTSTFDTKVDWKSPISRIFAVSSTFEDISNITLLSYGRTGITTVNKQSTSGFYETFIDISQSADSGFINTETRFVCDSDDSVTTFTIGNTEGISSGCLWEMRQATGDLRNAWINELISAYNSDGDLNSWINNSCNDVATGLLGADVTTQYIYPINSSGGFLNYSFEGGAMTITVTGGTTAAKQFIDIIDLVSLTSTNIDSQTKSVGSGGTAVFDDVSGSLVLPENRQQLFVVTLVKNFPLGFSSSITGGINPSMNLEIFTHQPNFVCGEFGECLNNSQSRVCVDSFGISPDFVEQQGCFDVPSFTNVLGFEEVISTGDVYTCQRSWNILNCPLSLETITAQFPVNWTVSGDQDIFTNVTRQNYIRMTQDTSTEGFQSLQMWYIPPKTEEPINNGTGGTVCGNKTFGDFPVTTHPFNETTFVAANVSFPAPFVQIRLDVRKCDAPIVQRDNSNDTWSILCDGILGSGSDVRKKCYARDCVTEPKGRFGVLLTDTDDSSIILDYRDNATVAWDNRIIDLSNAGLQANRNYTLSISVNPQNQFDQDTHCLYFDNVQATITDGPLPECVSKCDDINHLDLLLVKESGDICVFTRITNSPQCAPDAATAELMENFEPFCDPFDPETRNAFNTQTGLWERIENSTICIDDIIDEEGADALTTPLSSLQENLDFILFLVSPIFIYFFISIVISATVIAFTKHWEPGALSFGFMLLVGSLVKLPGSDLPVIPEFVTITMILAIVLLFASRFAKQVSSGGTN